MKLSNGILLDLLQHFSAVGTKYRYKAVVKYTSDYQHKVLAIYRQPKYTRTSYPFDEWDLIGYLDF